jgi:hypothetical protein
VHTPAKGIHLVCIMHACACAQVCVYVCVGVGVGMGAYVGTCGCEYVRGVCEYVWGVYMCVCVCARVGSVGSVRGGWGQAR